MRKRRITKIRHYGYGPNGLFSIDSDLIVFGSLGTRHRIFDTSKICFRFEFFFDQSRLFRSKMMRRTEKLKEAFEGACPQRIWKSRPIDEGLFVIDCDGMNQTDAELCGASMVHEGNLGRF